MQVLRLLNEICAWPGWEAVGAVGAVGALWYAIWLSSASERDKRRREAATLKALMQPLGSTFTKMTGLLGALRLKAHGSKEIAEAYRLGFQGFRDTLDIAPVFQLPSTTAVMIVGDSKAAFGELLAFLSLLETGREDLEPYFLRVRQKFDRNCQLLAEEIVSLGGGVTATDTPDIVFWLKKAKARRRVFDCGEARRERLPDSTLSSIHYVDQAPET